mmetsp:Transcript_25080/g.28829  ORF Transcript_25080/g.28829 Transcript_25080/m.28829 type:complete len:333 (+) Transcript_25080:15-1013(+)
MFDYFCIFTTGGVVLWYKAFVELKFDLINQLIKDIMIEEKTAKNQFIFKDNIIKWKIANDLNLVFTVVYKEVLHLTHIDELLEMISTEFIKKIVPNLEVDNGLYMTLPTYFDKHFMQIQLKWEAKTQDLKSPKKMRTFNESKKAKKNNPSAGISKSTDSDSKAEKPGIEETAVDETQGGEGDSKLSSEELARKKLASRYKKSNTIKKKEPEKVEESKSKSKEGRFWGFKDKITDEDKKRIDRSKTVSEDSKFEEALRRYGPDEGDSDPDYWESDEEDKEVENKGGLFSRFTSKIKSFTGNKEITEDDIDPIMKVFSDGLMEKNVAQEIAVSL